MARRWSPSAWLVVAAGVASLAGCSSSPSSASTTTTTVPVGTIQPSSTSSTTAAVAAPAPPPAPQPSPSDASDALVRGWEAGNRAYAASVATAPAVATLFARPYQDQTLVSRGCTTAAFPPVVCSYGPNGGGSGSLYQVTLTQTSGGWYVSKVTVEG